jgi:hypothetical protein
MNRSLRVLQTIGLALLLPILGACERHSADDTAPFFPRQASSAHGHKPEDPDSHGEKKKENPEPDTFIAE